MVNLQERMRVVEKDLKLYKEQFRELKRWVNDSAIRIAGLEQEIGNYHESAEIEAEANTAS